MNNQWTKRWLKTAVIAVGLILLIAGCSKGDEKKLKIAYVAWDSEIASNHVLKAALEQKLDYKVDLLQVDAGPMYAGLADGSADVMVAAWLPTTHKDYYEKHEGKFEDLGPNLDGTKVGLVVPAYMDVNSIEDLKNEQAGESLKYTITGIEPGAGIMSATEEAIKQYGLDATAKPWTLLESSSAGMTTELEKAYKEQRPIVVTGWTPHWKFARMDLKYLEDPLNVYGGDEQIHTLVRLGLKEDHPEAYELLDRFEWTAEDMESVMLEIQGGKSPEDAAAAWVETHQDVVDAWAGQ